MRCVSLAIVLGALLTTAVRAQPVVSPEVVSAPIEGLGEFALAPQHDGFVIAWEAAGRVYAGHLDSALQLTGAPLELPLTDPRETATSPAIATNGSSVLVAWHEQHLGWPDWNAVVTLSADTRVLLSAAQRLNLSATPAVAGVANGNYVVYSDELKYGFDDALEQTSFDSIPRPLSAAVSADGRVGTARESADAPYSCIRACFGWSCSGLPYPPCTVTSTVTFTVGAASSSARYTFQIAPNENFPDPFLVRPPIIGPDGDSCVGVVQYQNRSDFFFVGTSVQLSLPLTVTGQAAVAGNGNDALLVWTTPSLTGAIIHPDSTTSPPFLIAPAGYQPKVVNVNSNEFLVLYRLDAGTQHSAIAGRIVQLQPAKRRGIR